MFRQISLVIAVTSALYVIIEAQTYCTYEGHYYQNGESFYVNCSALCKCDLFHNPASSGHIACRSPCLDFSSLPNTCHMTAPPPGKCCPQPHCPATVTVQIPSEFANEYPMVLG